MPKIKITKVPGVKKYALGGDDDCGEGYIKDQFGNCIADFNYQPAQQKIGTGIPNITTPAIKNPTTAFAPSNSFNSQLPSMQIPQTGFDIWSNPTDITGQSANAMNMPKQTIIDAQGNATTRGMVDIGNPTMYQTQQTPTGPVKKQKNTPDFSNFDYYTSMAGALGNWIDQKQKQKEYDRWAKASRLPENYYGVDTSIDKGDYDQYGKFRPNLTGFKSKGQFANPYYAQNRFAAEGMTVPGDFTVRQAYIPDLPALNFPTAPMPSAPSTKAPITTEYQGEGIKGNIREVIAQKESGGDYRALPKKKDGTLASSAVGKYQFLWNQNKDWISKVTGINTKEGFRNNPEAQEQAFDYWDKNILTPQAQKIKKELGVKVPINNIKYSIHFAGPKGAYEYFRTGKETTDAFGSNIAKYANLNTSEYGGQNNNNMKIRITETPDETQMAYGGQPPYSGQSNYGLYIGQRNLYKTMAKHPYEDVHNTMSEEEPSKGNPHVLEAEDGETILRPDGTHMEISGKKHSEGGEKLTKEQAPEGSFIYSDTKKMRIKDPEVLKNFGKGGGNPTPAQLAKQYDTNKYMAILSDPNTDNLSKETARKMVDNYKRKLAELALVQEGMKGFPQGIPDVAKPLVQQMQSKQSEQGEENPQMIARYGGALSKFVDGGGSKNFIGPLLSDRLIPWRGDKFQNKANASRYSSREWADKLTSKGYTGDYSNEDVQKFIYSQPEGKKAVDALHDKYKGIIYGGPREGRYDAKVGYRWDTALDAIPDKTTVPVTPADPEIPMVDISQIDQEVPDEVSTNTLTVPGGDAEKQDIPYGWTSQNRRDLANAAVDYSTLKKYHGYAPSMQPALPEMTPVDWAGYAAALQSGAGKAAEQLGTYQPGSAAGANLSFLAGQQGETLGKYISDTDRANAGAATELSARRADILNQFTQANAATRKGLFDEENIYDDRYRAAERLARKGYVKAMDTGEDVASKLYNTSISESPYYYIDPRTQRIVFNSPAAKAAWEAQTKSGYQEQTGGPEAYIKIMKGIYDQLDYITDPKERQAAAEKYAHAMYFGNKTSTTTFPTNPSKSKTTRTSYDQD